MTESIVGSIFTLNARHGKAAPPAPTRRPGVTEPSGRHPSTPPP